MGERRASGILLPVSSLPSKYGIGCFSKSAYTFVDQLKAAGQSYWQILPLGPTSYGDSPYQSFSTFAGNPYFISLEALIEEGVLEKDECDSVDFGNRPASVDYGKLYAGRFKLLRKAYERSRIYENPEFKRFCEVHSWWLDDYALFMAVKDCFQGKSWVEWAEDIRFRCDNALDYYRKELYFDIEFYKYIQFKFRQQWMELKAYANRQGISIIGDIPIYVAFDSADTWAGPELFQLDDENMPVAVAGCPPDAFARTGQLWGNPLYRWDYHKNQGYDWWLRRLSVCFELYDVVRIDHFRGFDEYYSIPYGDETAEFGHWEKGPGYDIFQTMKAKLGKKAVIAEDLGFLTKSVINLVRKTGYPGMKILQFAFDSREESDYLPHNYVANSIVYTGTHDNDTTLGWYEKLNRKDKAFAKRYLNIKAKKDIQWEFIRAAMASVSDTCVIPMQDYLGLGTEARTNMPSTLGTNWKWRMLPGQFTQELADRILEMTRLYGRAVKG